MIARCSPGYRCFLTTRRPPGSSATSRIPVALLSASHSPESDLPAPSRPTTLPRSPMTNRRHLKTVEHPLQPRPFDTTCRSNSYWPLDDLLALSWQPSSPVRRLGAFLDVRHSSGHSPLSWLLGTPFNHLTPFWHSAADSLLKTVPMSCRLLGLRLLFAFMITLCPRGYPALP